MQPSSTPVDSATFASSLGTILGQGNVTDPMSQIVPFDPSMFQEPNLNDLITKAYNALAPYYTKLIQQANGDYNLVIKQLNDQTNLETRQAAESEAQNESFINQNLNAALKQLGLQFPQETQQLLDTLNQRGIAVNQSQPGGNAPLDTAKEGRAGYEMGQLTADQQLRQEAVQRSAQQQIQGGQLGVKQAGEKAQQALQTGTTSAQQSLRDTLQQYSTQRQQTALTEAQSQSQAQQTAQQLALQKQEMAAQSGGSFGGGVKTGSGVLASQLPNELANGNGNVSYGGATYNVQSNPNGTKNVSLVG